jgi:YHS domain-containing protein
VAWRVKDPVCGTAVDRRKALVLGKGGRIYYFCKDNCRRQFLAQDSAAAEQQEQALRGVQVADEHREHLAAQAVHCYRGMAHAEHPAYAGRHARMVTDFWRRFWISLVITVPIALG